WEPITLAGAPSKRHGHSAVWTGTRMIVWGGLPDNLLGGQLSDGGVYDPEGDVWSPVSTTNAPAARFDHTATWTGSMMVIWGGIELVATNSGGRYFPDEVKPPPSVDAGPDAVVECTSPDGTSVDLRGSGMSCGQSAGLQFTWVGPFPQGNGTAQGPNPSVTL